jgi:hypothetical protein
MESVKTECGNAGGLEQPQKSTKNAKKKPKKVKQKRMILVANPSPGCGYPMVEHSQFSFCAFFAMFRGYSCLLCCRWLPTQSTGARACLLSLTNHSGRTPARVDRQGETGKKPDGMAILSATLYFITQHPGLATLVLSGVGLGVGTLLAIWRQQVLWGWCFPFFC